jgi:hypothetical protein
MRAITLIMPYYENAGMLAEHVRVWATYPPELQAQLSVIVVDDGSPTSPAVWPPSPAVASFRLFRTEVDVRWNWLFCRNLGASVATTEWMLLTDIDHVLPVETLRWLVRTDKLEPRIVYRFSRVDAPHNTPYKPHPNTWLLTRNMFDKVGGYDERFSGYYGTDADFRERVHAVARAVVMVPQPLVRYPREVIPDASTTTYGRKETQDRLNVRRIRDARAELGQWRPLRVTFPYHEVRADACD